MADLRALPARSTSPACGTSCPASSVRSSGRRSGTERSGTSSSHERAGGRRGRHRERAGRPDRRVAARPLGCADGGARPAARPGPRRLEGDLPAARRARHLGRRRCRGADRGRGRHLDHRADLPPWRGAVQPHLRRRGPLAVPAVREHLAVAHRGDPRRVHRRAAADRGAVGAAGHRAPAGRRRGGADLRRRHAGAGVVRRAVPPGRGATSCARCSASRSTGTPSTIASSSATSAPTCPSGRPSGTSTSTRQWNPGRQVLVHPCPDSTFRIDWQVPADYDLDAEVRLGRAGPADPCGDRRPSVRDRLEVGVPLPLPLRRPDARRAGAAGRATLRTWWRRSVRAGSTPAWPTPRTPPGRSRSSCGLGRRSDLLESYHHERHAAARENLDDHHGDHGLPHPAERRAGWRTATTCSPAPRHDPAARAPRRLRAARGAVLVRRLAADHAEPRPSVRRPAGARDRAGPRGPGSWCPMRRVVREDEGSGTRIHARVSGSSRATGSCCSSRRVPTPPRRRRPRRVPKPRCESWSSRRSTRPVRSVPRWTRGRGTSGWCGPTRTSPPCWSDPTSATIETALHRALATTDREEDDHGVLPTVR